MSRFFLRILPALTLFFFAPNQSTFAIDTAGYTVEDIAAEATGKSPSAARTSAISLARRDAFLILLSRLDLNTSTADNISDDEIFEMVRSEQIDNEKIAGSRYSATMRIIFSKDFVDHILAQKKEQKSLAPNTFDKALQAAKDDEGVDEIDVIIPVKIINKKPIMWQEAGDWQRALESSIFKNPRKKLLLPAADISNLGLVNRDNVRDVTYDSLAPMMTRYKAEAAYVIFFSQDTVENRINVEISYIRKMQKKPIKLSFINANRLDYQDLLNKVAKKTIEYIISGQNTDNVSGGTSVLNIAIPINSLGEWLLIKRQIENSNLVNQIAIKSLSRNQVLISANYVNNGIEPAQAFERVGLSLSKQSDNLYILRR